jgi:hypothetical protein
VARPKHSRIVLEQSWTNGTNYPEDPDITRRMDLFAAVVNTMIEDAIADGKVYYEKRNNLVTALDVRLSRSMILNMHPWFVTLCDLAGVNAERVKNYVAKRIRYD